MKFNLNDTPTHLHNIPQRTCALAKCESYVCCEEREGAGKCDTLKKSMSVRAHSHCLQWSTIIAGDRKGTYKTIVY